MEYYDADGNDLPIAYNGKTQSEVEREHEEWQKRWEISKKKLAKFKAALAELSIKTDGASAQC